MKTDLSAMFWKEWIDCRRQLRDRLGLFVIIVVIASVVFPIVFLQEKLPDETATIIFQAFLIMGTVFYGTFLSDSSFFEERSNGTLQFLLCTSLSPIGIFLGKWLWMMSLCLLFALIANPVQFVFVHVYTGKQMELSFMDFAWSGLMITFALAICSLVISVNSAVSLWVSNIQMGRSATLVTGYSPILIGLIYNRLFNIPFDKTMLLAVGLTCVALAALAILSSCWLFKYQPPVI